MRVIIRADASVAVGTGHVMRCLAIAGELKKRGHNVRFLSRELPGNLFGRIKQEGFEVLRLASPSAPFEPAVKEPFHLPWLGVPLQNEIDECRAVLERAGGCDLLLVDSYALEAEWEGAAKPFCRTLAVLDDLYDRRHDCDVLIDYTLGRTPAAYGALVPSGCKLFCGLDYLPLRPEFAALRSQIKPRNFPPQRILVTLGGTDPHNFTAPVLEALAASPFKAALIDVVLTGGAPHLAANRDLSRRLGLNANWQIDTRKMAELILKADLAIGAAGVSSYERASLGLASVTLQTGENQAGNLKILAESGAIIATTPDRLRADLNALDENAVRKMEAAALTLCDAQGLARFCDALEQNV